MPVSALRDHKWEASDFTLRGDAADRYFMPPDLRRQDAACRDDITRRTKYPTERERTRFKMLSDAARSDRPSVRKLESSGIGRYRWADHGHSSPRNRLDQRIER